MTPNISIIIPVYNVEQYLAECLDSVVNQTMRDIQIICANDGSPDGSRAILQEYADCDARIEIIDKPNGGLSSARNAAYPLIQGKYALFVDSDDWIERDACEKLFDKAEQSGAEITAFFYRREGDRTEHINLSHRITPQDKITIQEKIPLFDCNSVCYKLWRSDFLRDNHLRFPEGLYFEDQLVCWQGITLASRISVVSEELYHYRYNPASTVNLLDKTGFDIIPIYVMIEKFLRDYGYYDDYRDAFTCRKLLHWHCHFRLMSPLHRSRFLLMCRESLTEDDRKFFYSRMCELDKKTLRFYRLLVDGGKIGVLKYHYESYFCETVKWPERLLRRWIIKPLKTLFGNRRNASQKAARIVSLPSCEINETNEEVQ